MIEARLQEVLGKFESLPDSEFEEWAADQEDADEIARELLSLFITGNASGGSSEDFRESSQPIEVAGKLLDNAEWDAIAAISNDDIQDALTELSNGNPPD